MNISDYAGVSFRFISDPGHGWVEVPHELLSLLDIKGKISFYSYQNEKFGYLEEDRDFGVFFKAYRKEFGEDPFLTEVYQENTFIRELNSFQI